MNHRIVIIFFALILVFSLSCKNENNDSKARPKQYVSDYKRSEPNLRFDKDIIISENYNFSEFESMDIESQVKFINSLDSKSKEIFIKIIFEKYFFSFPPNDEIKFGSNGVAFVFSYGQNGDGNDTSKYRKSFWKIENTKYIFGRDPIGTFPSSELETYDTYTASWWSNGSNKPSIEIKFVNSNTKNEMMLGLKKFSPFAKYIEKE